MLVLFGHGDPDYLPEMNLVWWVRTLLMAVLPVVLLVQLLILRGMRYSMVPDCVWLFLSVAVLMVVIQAYLDTGGGPILWHGDDPIPFGGRLCAGGVRRGRRNPFLSPFGVKDLKMQALRLVRSAFLLEIKARMRYNSCIQAHLGLCER